MNLLKLVWAALWRLQVCHGLLIVVLPAAAAILSAALGIVLLPFLVVGPGSTGIEFGSTLLHLREPSCWVPLAPCMFADTALVSLPWTAAISPPDTEPLLPVPSDINLRHATFLGWLGWFLAHLLKARRALKAD
jgi:hypothetical protein